MHSVTVKKQVSSKVTRTFEVAADIHHARNFQSPNLHKFSTLTTMTETGTSGQELEIH